MELGSRAQDIIVTRKAIFSLDAAVVPEPSDRIGPLRSGQCTEQIVVDGKPPQSFYFAKPVRQLPQAISGKTEVFEICELTHRFWHPINSQSAKLKVRVSDYSALLYEERRFLERRFWILKFPNSYSFRALNVGWKVDPNWSGSPACGVIQKIAKTYSVPSC